jgi:hypothetical protein
VAAQRIGDVTPGLELRTGEQAPEEVPGRCCVPAILHKDVEHRPELIAGTLEVMQGAGDAEGRLMKLPGRATLRLALA